METIRQVPSRDGILWFKVGWRMSLRNFAQIFGLVFLLFLIGIATNRHLIFQLIGDTLRFVLLAGSWTMARTWLQGQPSQFSKVFSLFDNQPAMKRLLPVLGASLLLDLCRTLLPNPQDSMPTYITFVVFIALVQMLFLTCVLPLMLLKELPFKKAISLSITVFSKNWRPLAWNGLYVSGLLILVFSPMLILSGIMLLGWMDQLMLQTMSLPEPLRMVVWVAPALLITGPLLILLMPGLLCMTYAMYFSLFENANMDEVHLSLAKKGGTSTPA